MAGTNLFDLAAKISVDAKGVDSTLTSTQKKVLSLAGEFKHLDTATATSKTGLAQLATETTGASSSLGVLTAIFPGAAAGAALFATGLGTLVGLIIKSATAYGDYGEKIHDTQLKMDISGESMARLSVIAKETNTDIDALARTSNRLQVGISRGLSEPSSEAGLALRLLNVDIKALSQESPDAQLQKVARGLLNISSASDRARASTALAGRGFAELKPALSDIAEKWEEAGRKANAFGLVLTQSQIDAADQYKDTLADIELATQGFLIQAGSRFVPNILGLLNDVAKGLGENEMSWVDWSRKSGDAINYLVFGMRVAAVAIKADLAGIAEYLRTGNLGSAIGKFFSVGTAANRSLMADARLQQATAGVVDAAAAARAGVPGVAGTGFPGTGAGSRGGGKVDHAALDALRERLRAVKDAARDTARELADVQREEKRLAEVSDSVNDAVFKQSQAVSDLESGYPEWLRQTYDFIVAKAREGYVWGEETKQIYLNNAARLEQLRILAQGATRARRVDEGITRSTGSETRGRYVTLDNIVMQQQMEAVKERARALAGDLTNTIDNALRDGFERGIKAGLITFAQGILDMIRSAALSALEKRLTAVFTNAIGGGGWLAKLLGIGLGVAAGAAGGGKGGISVGTGGKFAAGGFMQPNSWNLVGERGPELIRSGSHGATVLPNQALGGHTFIVNINVPDIQSAGSKATQYQVAKSMHAHLARAVLTG